MNKRCGIYVRVSTDEQRDNGYSIDSQLRMIKEYCEKNNYTIIDIYNDAGYSGKDLMRPNMQRLLKDIKSKKIDTLVAIKVDRLTRNNYDGFWLLNYCEEHDVKIVLILEPYDVSTANGEMIFGMNLVFGQRERKEIGARTKRAMEQMAIEKIHPAQAPYGYIRNKETGHLEIDYVEAEVVKEIFELYKKYHSSRTIAKILKNNNAYLKKGKWTNDRVYKILCNEIYIGIFAYGKYKRKKEDILYVKDYCEPIISNELWKQTRIVLERNKNPNYGTHIHLFSGIVRCPDCNKIMASTMSYKHSGKPNQITYYHLTCKNSNCKSKGKHYNEDKIEEKLTRVLNELTRYMYDIDNEILVSNSTKTKDIKDIEKAIEKLKTQEKRLIDLYLDSNINVESINQKNEIIKKEIDKLTNKKNSIDPNDDYKEYSIELLKKLDKIEKKNDKFIFKNPLAFSYIFSSLNKKSKRELIHRLIDSIEISRDKNYNIEIKNIKFSDELITKSPKEYIEYLYEILNDNIIGITYKEQINEQELNKINKKYNIYSTQKMEKNEYKNDELEVISKQFNEHFYIDGIICCPLNSNGKIVDHLLLIPKNV